MTTSILKVDQLQTPDGLKSVNVGAVSDLVSGGLSLGTISPQNANNVNITGGSISGLTTLAVAVGATVPTWNQDTTGNAATATALQTARTINGVSFDGTANITIADATKLPLTGGTLTGNLTTSGQVIVNNTTASTSPTTGSIRTTGGIGVGGAIFASGNISGLSDARLKTDIKPIESALHKVMSLVGVTYTRTDIGTKQTGLIAQDVLAVLPEAVSGGDDGEYLAVAYGNLAGLFVEAIKELNQKIDNLESENAELRNLINRG